MKPEVRQEMTKKLAELLGIDADSEKLIQEVSINCKVQIGTQSFNDNPLKATREVLNSFKVNINSNVEEGRKNVNLIERIYRNK